MTPYPDSAAHLLDELRRIDLLIRRHVEAWWTTNDTTDGFRGLYITDDEVDRLLTPTPPDQTSQTEPRGHQTTGPDPDVDFYADHITRATTTIATRAQHTNDHGTELRLTTLTDRFDLDRQHTDALLLSLAPDLDPKYGKIYAYLNDDITRTHPTVGLILHILCRSDTDRLTARQLFSPRSPLLRHNLVHLDTTDPLLTQAVRADDRIVTYLLGTDDLDDRLPGVTTITRPAVTFADLPVDKTTRTAIRRIARSNLTGDRPVLVYLHGPYGAGKRAAVHAICTATDTPLLEVDLAAHDPTTHPDTIRAVVREAQLQHHAIHIRNLPDLDNDPNPEDPTTRDQHADSRPTTTDLLRTLDKADGVAFASGHHPVSPRLAARLHTHRLATIHLPVPAYDRRRDLWAATDALPPDVDPAELAATFRLTGGQIADAITTATTLAAGDPLTRDAVYAACRAQSTDRLDSLARPITPSYTWDDIVLPPAKLTQLREVAAHIKHQGTVYGDWGFKDKFSLGAGLIALFTGPSGTGKTMATEIIAHDVGLALHKIDLATVVSKYIGETETNLRRIFDEARDTNAILLFDEADALFGKRSEVRDAHDRYANIEVNYLLQRVEEHDGTVILTTNFEGNIDDAFRRRIHLSIDFPAPDRASRERIWRQIFPADTPVGDLDYEYLASLDIAGGNIRNIAQIAAFLAADDGQRVEMPHVIRAAEREYEKVGKLIEPETFGDYTELLTPNR